MIRGEDIDEEIIAGREANIIKPTDHPKPQFHNN